MFVRPDVLDSVNGREAWAIADEWLTYEQAGQRLGITAEAARQRSRRLRWPHRSASSNEGGPRRSLVLVPDRPVPPVQEHENLSGQVFDQTPVQPGQANGSAGEVAALRALVDVLQAQLGKAEAHMGAAEGREAAAALAAERGGRELTAALLRTAIAETEARALREALTEVRRPAWRRWLGLP